MIGCLMKSDIKGWVLGEPPHDKEVCWLQVRSFIVDPGESETNVVLAVHDGQVWCEAGCWRGVTCDAPVLGEILAYQDYVIPEPPSDLHKGNQGFY